MNMLIHQFNYFLPKKLIAQSPTLPRDYCRLLVYDRSKDVIHHDVFFNLGKYLQPSDVLILNDTKVIPVRINFLWQQKKAEIFFVEHVQGNRWIIMGSPGKMLTSSKIELENNLKIEILKDLGETRRLAEINLSKSELIKYLNKFGKMPLPPYIKTEQGVEYYSSVFEKSGESIAAPTAGLHFTKRLLNKLRIEGIGIDFITLEVGLGTFLPVKATNLDLHQMHREKYQISSRTAKLLNETYKKKRRLVMVGTTVTRCLEDNFLKHKKFVAGEDSTDIFIKNKEQLQVTNGLVTNFHLPKSTLLVLVSAMIGREKALQIYEIAVRKGYRFFSYGDAMMII